MKVSDYIAEFLLAQGVTHVFEVIGGMITHMIDSLGRQGKIWIVSCHHEQAAAFAAEGFARIKGVPGVAMATSGPGATNLITGIGSCYFDSVPAVFITGQVNRNELKGDRCIRQLGFQETDIVSVTAPITKASLQVTIPEEVPSLLTKAFSLALSGRPGPVLLDIPMDVQRAEIAAITPSKVELQPSIRFGSSVLDKLISDMKSAQRPLILGGGGIRSARAIEHFRNFVEIAKVPVVNSLMAVDALSYDHPLRVGMIGTYGNRWVNLAVANSDFLLVLGSRLDIRQTGSRTDFFKGERTIYHVDCEPGEVNNRVKGCFEVSADLNTFLSEALERYSKCSFPERPNWLAEIHNLRSQSPDTDELEGIAGINPNQFMHQLASSSHQTAAFVVDVGQHQMWAAQSLELGPDQRFLTSGGMGAMGFALPAAIGTALAQEVSPVVAIAGDGAFQLNIQELQTVARNHLPIKIVVVNNQCYGMVRQFQQDYFEKRYHSTCWGYTAPDFARVSQAFGIGSQTVSDPSEVQNALNQMWHNPKEPYLLQVLIDTRTNVYPKIAFGRPITEMDFMAAK